jgi:hypothetical protein
MFSLYDDDDDGGGGGDDVDVDIADDTKVSFLSIFIPLRCSAPCF